MYRTAAAGMALSRQPSPVLLGLCLQICSWPGRLPHRRCAAPAGLHAQDCRAAAPGVDLPHQPHAAHRGAGLAGEAGGSAAGCPGIRGGGRAGQPQAQPCSHEWQAGRQAVVPAPHLATALRSQLLAVADRLAACMCAERLGVEEAAGGSFATEVLWPSGPQGYCLWSTSLPLC